MMLLLVPIGAWGSDRLAPDFIDILPPRIVVATYPVSASFDSSVIAWETDEESTSLVEYGPTQKYQFRSTPNTTRVIQHGVTLTRLKPATTYYYRLVSKDALGNTVRSEGYSFITPPEGILRQASAATFPSAP
jgi:hypothetical protein